MDQERQSAEESQFDPADTDTDDPPQDRLLRWWKWYILAAVFGISLAISGLPGDISEFFIRLAEPPPPEPTALRIQSVTPMPTESTTLTPTPPPFSPVDTDGTLVLVADFHDPADQPQPPEGGFSLDLVDQMQQTLTDHSNIRIERLNFAIDPQGGSEQARSLAQDYIANVSMVVWGYPVDSSDADLRINFEMVDDTPTVPDEHGQESSKTIHIQPDRFAFNVDSNADFDQLSAFVSALALFSAGEHMAAAPLFDDVAKKASAKEQSTDLLQSFHLFRGSNLIHLGRVQEALPELEALLPIGPGQYADNESFDYSLRTNLGMVYAYLGDLESALDQHTQALLMTEKMGDRRRKAIALGNLGLVYRSLGQSNKAVDHYQRAIAIDRVLGDRRAEAVDLGDLGLAYADQGQVNEAIDHYQQAMTIAQEIGDRRVEGNGLVNLANAYVASERLDEAIVHYRKALAITQEIGNPWGEGAVLANMGLVYAELGRTEEAVDLYEQALTILDEIGSPNAETVRQMLAEVSG